VFFNNEAQPLFSEASALGLSVNELIPKIPGNSTDRLGSGAVEDFTRDWDISHTHWRYPRWNLDTVVAELRQSREITHNIRPRGRIRGLPSKEALLKILSGLSAALFPTHFGRPDLSEESVDYFVGNVLNDTLGLLVEQLRRALSFADHADQIEEQTLLQQSVEITRTFAEQLPAIRALLVSDLKAAFQGDPAATSYPEILLSYPGMSAIIAYRLARPLYLLNAPILAKLISNIAHSTTAIDIHPGADIGGGFFIDHGTGVVIGETCIIGERVRIYQGVTLGAKRFPVDEHGAAIKGHARHPIIEDDVVIYAGATILGRITVGRGSVIGGNVWLTHSVPVGSVVSQAQATRE
jgi:serine O-acetyltransferase